MAKGIFVGLATIDIVYTVDRFPLSNEKIVAHSQDLLVGGPATNASVVFAHLGGKTTLVTAVGRHASANVLLDEFKRYAIQLSDLHPEFVHAPVISSVSVDKEGNRNVISVNATRVDAPPAQPDPAVLQGIEILLIDGHYMDSCQAWAAAAHKQGVRVVLDGGSWKEGTEQLLDSVDTAICSADFHPPGCPSDDSVFAYLKARGVANIAITRGAEPIRFASPNAEGAVRIPPTEVADTLGAGDFFHGAFCFHAAARCGFVEALVEASRVASLSCQYPGTREWLGHLS